MKLSEKFYIAAFSWKKFDSPEMAKGLKTNTFLISINTSSKQCCFTVYLSTLEPKLDWITSFGAIFLRICQMKYQMKNNIIKEFIPVYKYIDKSIICIYI